jgi:hypothetical protein
MHTTTTRRVLVATTLLAVALGAAACGDETIADPGTTGYEARIYPPTSVPAVEYKHRGAVSADQAERQAQAEKARQDSASTARWDRSSQIENRLKLRRTRRA